jgi:hypothetical protein
MHRKFESGNLKGRDHAEDLGVGCEDTHNVKMDLMETGWEGFIWLRIGTNGGLL